MRAFQRTQRPSDSPIVIDLISSDEDEPPVRRQSTGTIARNHSSSMDVVEIVEPPQRQFMPAAKRPRLAEATGVPPSPQNGLPTQQILATAAVVAIPTTINQNTPKRVATASSASEKRPGIKFEAVAFGEADNDEVQEVGNPNISAANTPTAAAATPLPSEKHATDDNMDEDIVFLAGSESTAVDMPHQRESCPVKKFSPYAPSVNVLYCPNCYCYICDVKASECGRWQRHCGASYRNSVDKLERSLRKSDYCKLMSPKLFCQLYETEKEQLIDLILETGGSNSASSSISNPWNFMGQVQPSYQNATAIMKQVTSALNKIVEFKKLYESKLSAAAVDVDVIDSYYQALLQAMVALKSLVSYMVTSKDMLQVQSCSLHLETLCKYILALMMLSIGPGSLICTISANLDTITHTIGRISRYAEGGLVTAWKETLRLMCKVAAAIEKAEAGTKGYFVTYHNASICKEIIALSASGKKLLLEAAALMKLPEISFVMDVSKLTNKLQAACKLSGADPAIDTPTSLLAIVDCVKLISVEDWNFSKITPVEMSLSAWIKLLYCCLVADIAIPENCYYEMIWVILYSMWYKPGNWEAKISQHEEFISLLFAMPTDVADAVGKFIAVPVKSRSSHESLFGCLWKHAISTVENEFVAKLLRCSSSQSQYHLQQIALLLCDFDHLNAAFPLIANSVTRKIVVDLFRTLISKVQEFNKPVFFSENSVSLATLPCLTKMDSNFIVLPLLPVVNVKPEQSFPGSNLIREAEAMLLDISKFIPAELLQEATDGMLISTDPGYKIISAISRCGISSNHSTAMAFIRLAISSFICASCSCASNIMEIIATLVANVADQLTAFHEVSEPAASSSVVSNTSIAIQPNARITSRSPSTPLIRNLQSVNLLEWPTDERKWTNFMCKPENIGICRFLTCLMTIGHFCETFNVERDSGWLEVMAKVGEICAAQWTELGQNCTVISSNGYQAISGGDINPIWSFWKAVISRLMISFTDLYDRPQTLDIAEFVVMTPDTDHLIRCLLVNYSQMEKFLKSLGHFEHVIACDAGVLKRLFSVIEAICVHKHALLSTAFLIYAKEKFPFVCKLLLSGVSPHWYPVASYISYVVCDPQLFDAIDKYYTDNPPAEVISPQERLNNTVTALSDKMKYVMDEIAKNSSIQSCKLLPSFDKFLVNQLLNPLLLSNIIVSASPVHNEIPCFREFVEKVFWTSNIGVLDDMTGKPFGDMTDDTLFQCLSQQRTVKDLDTLLNAFTQPILCKLRKLVSIDSFRSSFVKSISGVFPQDAEAVTISDEDAASYPNIAFIFVFLRQLDVEFLRNVLSNGCLSTAQLQTISRAHATRVARDRAPLAHYFSIGTCYYPELELFEKINSFEIKVRNMSNANEDFVTLLYNIATDNFIPLRWKHLLVGWMAVASLKMVLESFKRGCKDILNDITFEKSLVAVAALINTVDDVLIPITSDKISVPPIDEAHKILVAKFQTLNPDVDIPIDEVFSDMSLFPWLSANLESLATNNNELNEDILFLLFATEKYPSFFAILRKFMTSYFRVDTVLEFLHVVLSQSHVCWTNDIHQEGVSPSADLNLTPRRAYVKLADASFANDPESTENRFLLPTSFIFTSGLFPCLVYLSIICQPEFEFRCRHGEALPYFDMSDINGYFLQEQEVEFPFNTNLDSIDKGPTVFDENVEIFRGEREMLQSYERGYLGSSMKDYFQDLLQAVFACCNYDGGVGAFLKCLFTFNEVNANTLVRKMIVAKEMPEIQEHWQQAHQFLAESRFHMLSLSQGQLLLVVILDNIRKQCHLAVSPFYNLSVYRTQCQLAVRNVWMPRIPDEALLCWAPTRNLRCLKPDNQFFASTIYTHCLVECVNATTKPSKPLLKFCLKYIRTQVFATLEKRYSCLEEQDTPGAIKYNYFRFNSLCNSLSEKYLGFPNFGAKSFLGSLFQNLEIVMSLYRDCVADWLAIYVHMLCRVLKWNLDVDEGLGTVVLQILSSLGRRSTDEEGEPTTPHLTVAQTAMILVRSYKMGRLMTTAFNTPEVLALKSIDMKRIVLYPEIGQLFALPSSLDDYFTFSYDDAKWFIQDGTMPQGVRSVVFGLTALLATGDEKFLDGINQSAARYVSHLLDVRASRESFVSFEHCFIHLGIAIHASKVEGHIKWFENFLKTSRKAMSKKPKYVQIINYHFDAAGNLLRMDPFTK